MGLIQEFLQQTLIYQIMLVIIVALGLLVGYLNTKRQEVGFEMKRLKDIIGWYQYLLDLPDNQPSNHKMKTKTPTIDRADISKSNPGILGKFFSLKALAIDGSINNSMIKVNIPDIPTRSQFSVRLLIKRIIEWVKIQCQSIKRRTQGSNALTLT